MNIISTNSCVSESIVIEFNKPIEDKFNILEIEAYSANGFYRTGFCLRTKKNDTTAYNNVSVIRNDNKQWDAAKLEELRTSIEKLQKGSFNLLLSLVSKVESLT
jgi:hypothetical protein